MIYKQGIKMTVVHFECPETAIFILKNAIA